MPKLSDTQLVVLNAACQRDDRCVFPVAGKLKGNAAGNVLKSLLIKGLLEEIPGRLDDTIWRQTDDGPLTLRATDAALAALGIDTRAETSDAAEPSKAAKKSRATAKTPSMKQSKPAKRGKSQPQEKVPRTARADSKQAQLIAMLKRAKGASIDEIVEAMGWLPHTARGVIAGALKKKLGLDVTSEKTDGQRVYRIES